MDDRLDLNARLTDSENSQTAERPATIAGFLASERPMVIAHRGFSAQAPENTLAAVRQAIEVGADMVEIDVTLTADGEVIVLHDDTLDRTTDGQGPALDATLDDVRALDAGSWFSERYAGEKVPTLDEVLVTVDGQILLNIEIKTEAVKVHEDGNGIASKVAALVRRRAMTERVIVSSFDPRPLSRLRRLAPEIRTASLYNPTLHRGLKPSEVIGAVGAVAFNVGGRHLDAAMLAELETLGVPVAVYTVDREDEMRQLLGLGVHALFTNHPDRMLRLLGRGGKEHSGHR